MKIELGCGPNPSRWQKGNYLRSDVRELPGIDYVCAADNLPEELKGKLTEIRGYHILESRPVA